MGLNSAEVLFSSLSDWPHGAIFHGWRSSTPNVLLSGHWTNCSRYHETLESFKKSVCKLYCVTLQYRSSTSISYETVSVTNRDHKSNPFSSKCHNIKIRIGSQSWLPWHLLLFPILYASSTSTSSYSLYARPACCPAAWSQQEVQSVCNRWEGCGTDRSVCLLHQSQYFKGSHLWEHTQSESVCIVLGFLSYSFLCERGGI